MKPPVLPDHSLWVDVTHTIQPLKSQRSASVRHAVTSARPILNRMLYTQAVHPAQLIQRHEPPPIAAFDRRTAQKLSRGQMEPDSRIDLHGETVETARMKLYAYLQSQQHQGNRLVLVITGKGASPYARHTLHTRQVFHTPEREGRLRREVVLWFHEAQFRSHVVGYQPAHPRHGGGGAFYVKLRKAHS